MDGKVYNIRQRIINEAGVRDGRLTKVAVQIGIDHDTHHRLTDLAEQEEISFRDAIDLAILVGLSTCWDAFDKSQPVTETVSATLEIPMERPEAGYELQMRIRSKEDEAQAVIEGS